MSYLDNLFSLRGKVAMVTGATRGLGRAMAKALLLADAGVILVGSNARRLNETADAFRSDGLVASAMACDLAEPTQIEKLVEDTLLQHDRFDVLVNNAGVSFTHSVLDYPDDAWRRTLAVNVEAPFQLARRLSPLMKDTGGGSIINITSINAELGFPDNPAYAVAKGGLSQLTRALAADLGPHGIRVNNIGPGYFKTDMAQRSWNDPRRRRERARRTLLGRWGEPDDLAGAVVFLASDASSYITGQSLYIDGGWLVKGL